MSLTKTKTEEKNIWFCGCEIERGDEYGTTFSFNRHDEHELRFNAEKIQNEYICHKNKVVKIEKYLRHE